MSKRSRSCTINSINKPFENQINEIYNNYVEDKLTPLYLLKEVVEKNLKKVVTLSEEIGEGIEDEEEVESHQDESVNIEISVNHKLAILNEFLTKKKLATVSRLPEISRLSTASTTHSNNAKLPKLKTKVFSGQDFTEQSLFYELFLEAIDKNHSLTDIERMNYLTKLLSDEALMIANGLKLSNCNHHVALDLLTERFGDPQLLISEHIGNFQTFVR